MVINYVCAKLELCDSDYDLVISTPPKHFFEGNIHNWVRPQLADLIPFRREEYWDLVST